ncbi:hypothetical protein [Sphingomonas sp. EC-HK361]|uniref:hypothetical protein n=1 Tax=Sphingomonas sp. EC-HK361 TaxID=2038397 RepID=UPI00125F1743|nr:hypothetical protein [Sphingomonas sp. EC-HK361]
MRYFARMNPLRAVRDLRLFLSQREKYELWFGILAVSLTLLLLIGFLHDSRMEAPAYDPEIIYVQQWPANRTDAEIRAQQKIDQAKKDERQAIIDAREAKSRAALKRLDEQLDRMGI